MFLKPRLPLSFTDINDGFGGDSSLIRTFILLAITKNSRETFPLRTQRKERIKYTSHQLHELEAAFKINQCLFVDCRGENIWQEKKMVLLSQEFRCITLFYYTAYFGCGSQTKERSAKLQGTRLMKQDQDQTTQNTTRAEVFQFLTYYQE